MRGSTRLHPLSLALGAVGCGLALYLASAATPRATTRVAGIPTPSQIVRLTANDMPFTVPGNQTLVLTEVGWTAMGGTDDLVSILIDGQHVISAVIESSSHAGGAPTVFEPGVVVEDGSVLNASKVYGNGIDFVLLGYLARN